MKLAAVAVVISLAIAGAQAHAQPSTAVTAEPETVSTTEAVLLSLGGTAVSASLVVSGAATRNPWLVGGGLLTSLFTPSLGHWYAGRSFTPGMGLRLVGLVVALAGLPAAVESTIYDVATAHRSAERWNAKHVRIAPSVVTSGTHATLGLGIGGTF